MSSLMICLSCSMLYSSSINQLPLISTLATAIGGYLQPHLQIKPMYSRNRSFPHPSSTLFDECRQKLENCIHTFISLFIESSSQWPETKKCDEQIPCFHLKTSTWNTGALYYFSIAASILLQAPIMVFRIKKKGLFLRFRLIWIRFHPVWRKILDRAFLYKVSYSKTKFVQRTQREFRIWALVTWDHFISFQKLFSMW